MEREMTVEELIEHLGTLSSTFPVYLNIDGDKEPITKENITIESYGGRGHQVIISPVTLR